MFLRKSNGQLGSRCQNLSTIFRIVLSYRSDREIDVTYRKQSDGSRRLRAQKSEPLGDGDQLGQGRHLHLCHHLVPMRLYGALGGSKLVSDLLIDLPAHDEVEDLSLASRQRRQTSTKRIQLALLAAHHLLSNQCALDRVDQLFRRYWFGQKVFRAGLDRANSRCGISMPCQEHDRQRRRSLGEARLQLRAAQARNLHVEQDAARMFGARGSSSNCCADA